MIRNTTLLALGFSGASVLSLVAFSSDSSSLTRTFDQTVVITNSPIRVTATFTNGGSNALRGCFYSEQLPSELTVSTLSVTLNGQNLTNFTLETGRDGDVYAGLTPWRWRLETPTNFTEAHPLPGQAVFEIKFTLNSPIEGSFLCPGFAWVGYSPAGTNASFGCSESADQQTVYFVTTTKRAAVSAQISSTGSVIYLHGEPGITYVLESSPDLVSWLPLATNVCCFSFADTNSPRFSSRWYRGRLFIGCR
jgi:hypothetical protein